MKRIFMFSSHPLFSEGVEALLRQDKELDLEFVGRETNTDKAIECIKSLHPDIVIVDHDFPACNQLPILMRIWEEGLSIKIIGLNLLNNSMCIYHGEHRAALKVEDLYKAIDDDLNGIAFAEKNEQATEVI